MTAIACLLQMEGNKNPAFFSGAVSNDVSSYFENTTADVAALFYISYLFQQKWHHANAVALRGSDGSVNTPKLIDRAFKGYKKWFEKVKTLGLQKAREQKLDPLKGTKVSWY